MNRILFICFLLFITPNLWSNSQKLEAFFNAAKNQNYENAILIASEINDPALANHLSSLAVILARKSVTTEDIINYDHTADSELNYVKLLISAYQNNYATKQNNLEAYKKFSSALKLADEIENTVYIKAALIGILDLFAEEIFIGSKQFEPYLTRFIELKTDMADEVLIVLYKLIFLSKADDDIDSIDAQYYSYYAKLDSIFTKLPKTHAFYPQYYFEKGIYHKIEENFDKAEDFFLKADSVAAKNKYMDDLRGMVPWQLSAIKMQNNQLLDAKRYLKLFKNHSSKLRDSFYYTRLASAIFQKEGNFDSAYHYLRKSVDIEYQLGYKNNTLESSILTVQNQTDKLKLDKLELTSQNKQSRNKITALALVLLFGSVITFLVFNNSRRKRLLAVQEKTVQEQKIITILKEQELTTIDAMIEGQEKERQRIANELHDDLGSLMATVKIHFNSLHSKVKDDTDELYEKTNHLLDAAYQKIRAIAHAKNSGVIAKQGLLKAIEHMADKISAANSISITVKDFGLDNRIENSLELSLFRVVQELVTNIIKHANANNANIHLTNHGDTLNILVEDDGIGFNVPNKMTSSKGMGLKSIAKRIAHLGGTLDIESKPGKGASIIIDIPL